MAFQKLIYIQKTVSGLPSIEIESLNAAARTEPEAALAAKFVCSREYQSNGVDLLKLCGASHAQYSHPKIVALVELRNVEKLVEVFLTALSHIVDSIVILDDHSTDLTRNFVLLFNERQARYAQQSMGQNPIVEILINKTGEWVREELFDRQILLTVGRKVGGTHFVLLDYDEYISTNCVHSGLLRREILALRQGESLYLPWVELWKSKYLHAVLARDVTMNFLTRRQVVIFADDGISQFTKRNSIAKVVSNEKVDRNASIHVLRCPRSLCSQPPRYNGSEIKWGWGNVKLLSQCKIIETRFLNLNNVLLKSAWYEALGRVLGAEDGLTTGKMVGMLEAKLNPSLTNYKDRKRLGPESSFKLVPTDLHWLSGFDDHIFDTHQHVELWRAKEILKWHDEFGKNVFKDLRIMPLLDVAELRSVVDSTLVDHNEAIYHVPQTKFGTLILAVNPQIATIVTDLLIEIGVSQIDMRSVRGHLDSNPTLWDNPIAREEWMELARDEIARTFQVNQREFAFIQCNASEESLVLSLLDLARNELSTLTVLTLFGDCMGPQTKSPLFERAVKYATETGSHLRVLDMPLAKFGSAASVLWLTQQVNNLEGVEMPKSFENRSISFAERVHRQLGDRGIPLEPVARLIFSLNVGRCGSRYMANVLKTAGEPITAIHEGQCPGRECTRGGGMRMQDVPLTASYDIRKRLKLPLIRAGVSKALQTHKDWVFSQSPRACSALARDPNSNAKEKKEHMGRGDIVVGQHRGCFVYDIRDAVYAETNPNFKAWFYDVVLDNMPTIGYDIDVLVVRKYIAAVLKSLYETGFFIERDGYTWMETSAGVNSRVHIEALRDDNLLDASEKLMSYVVNAEAVFTDVEQHYTIKFPQQRKSRRIRFLHVRAEDIYGAEGAESLLRQLGLRSSEKTHAAAVRVHDKYGVGGRKRSGRISLDRCVRNVNRFIANCGGEESLVGTLLSKWGRIGSFNYGLVEEMSALR